MKLKLDENLGERTADLFRQAGMEVSTVPEQSLCGTSDRKLADLCRKDGRCLVTLDLDFGNPLLFTPSEYCGIALLRLPPRPVPQDLWDAARTLIGGLSDQDITGKLWVVQRGRIREYQEEVNDNG